MLNSRRYFILIFGGFCLAVLGLLLKLNRFQKYIINTGNSHFIKDINNHNLLKGTIVKKKKEYVIKKYYIKPFIDSNGYFRDFFQNEVKMYHIFNSNHLSFIPKMIDVDFTNREIILENRGVDFLNLNNTFEAFNDNISNQIITFYQKIWSLGFYKVGYGLGGFLYDEKTNLVSFIDFKWSGRKSLHNYFLEKEAIRKLSYHFPKLSKSLLQLIPNPLIN